MPRSYYRSGGLNCSSDLGRQRRDTSIRKKSVRTDTPVEGMFSSLSGRRPILAVSPEVEHALPSSSITTTQDRFN